jgi:hypothetical protein
MKETPDTIHGRLLEAVHISGYSFERACKDLEWLLKENKWKKVGSGFKTIDDFLDTVDFSEYKIAIEQRKKLVKMLSDLRATQRATGKMLGVSHVTIGKDLSAGKKLPKTKPQTIPAEDKIDGLGKKLPTPPPMIAQSGPHAAKAAAKAANKEEAAKETVARREASRNAPPHPDGPDLRIGDARKVLSDVAENSVHLVLTDPPYGDKAEPLYNWLAEWSSRILVPGGSLICFTGQSRLDRDINIFAKCLRYWWLLAMRHNQAQRLPGKFVMAEFKPVLWFVKDYRRGTTLVNDVLRSDRRDKEGHDWGQGDGGVELLIEQLTDPDELIIDPFAGTGRWGEIANRMGRKWIGADIVQGGDSKTVS